MFLGEYIHTIDNKCRLTIPAKFREALKNKCVIAKGFDHCLTVYPMEEWALVCEKIDAQPASDQKVRRFKRQFYASATVEDLDKQGRLSIPNSLMDYASIEKDVAIIGQSNTFEIWSTELWNNQQEEETEFSFEALAEVLGI